MNIFLLIMMLIIGSIGTKNINVITIEEKPNEQIKMTEGQISLNDIKLVDSLYNKENIMVSPLSLNLALGMVTNGAEGETL